MAVIPRLDRGIQKTTGCPIQNLGHDGQEMSIMTLKMGIEKRLKERVPEVKEVVAV
jgi:Fe-S cluster biogenesis protein NfuA